MLQPWFNTHVTIQRRSANPSRNVLGEPNYGAEASYTTVYTALWTRIEYPDLQMEYKETGERIKLSSSAVSGVSMYIDPAYTVQPADRVTITSSDDPALINQLYLVTAVYPEWDSMGNVHHYVVELQVH